MTKKKAPAERDRLIRQALVQLFRLEILSGVTRSELSRLAQECISKACNDADRNAVARRTLDAQDYGTVLKTWHRQSEYLSRDGFPRGLTINGQFGLRTLIEHFYPKIQFMSVLESLRDSGLIIRTPNGRWHPTDKCAVFPRLNQELLVHLSEAIAYLINTVTSNVTARNRNSALFERSAKVRFLPASKTDEFRKFVSRQGSSFLGAVDDWLESKASDARSRQVQKCTAGAFAFAFIDWQKGSRPGTHANARFSPNRKSRP